MKNTLLFIVILCSFGTKAQDSLIERKYQFAYFNQYDLRNSSSNMIATNRLLHDVFRKGVSSKMNEKWGNVTYGVFSFATTYMSMLWSHEFGHSLRAAQVGGHFRIHNGALPIPYTTMHLPDSISLTDEALSVTAGFEVNALNTRSIQYDFITNNGLANEDLAFSFANRIMYPLYSSLIVPRDPEKKEVWINTAGDPIHIALPVFKNYSGGQVFLEDSMVNPALVRYYNQSSIFALVLNLLDPQLYREVGATFGKKKPRSPIFLVGNHRSGWTYGTLFNTSPLGYELHMNNYIHINDNKFRLTLKYGNPFKNNGLGIGWNEILRGRKVYLSAALDIWDQDLFGAGVAGEVISEYRTWDKLGFFASLGYKTEGYVLGKQIDQGLNFGVGITYYSNY